MNRIKSCIIAAAKNNETVKAMTRGFVGAILGTVLAAFSGCGGGGGGSSTQTHTAAPAPASTPETPSPTISVLFEGDSTTFGTGAPAGQSEPDDVAALLPAVKVTNAGVYGTWTAQNLSGTAPFTSPLATRLASDSSQIVVMNYALNDSQRVSIDTYRQNLVDWVSTVRASGKVAVFAEPNPATQAGYQQPVTQCVSVMDDVAQQLNVPLVKQYDYMQTLPNWQSLLNDGLHPNAQGYQVKAQRTAAVLKQVIASYQASN